MQCFLCKSEGNVTLMKQCSIYVEEKYALAEYHCSHCGGRFVAKNSFNSIVEAPTKEYKITEKTLASTQKSGIVRGVRYCWVCENVSVTQKKVTVPKMSYNFVEEYHYCTHCGSRFKTYNEFLHEINLQELHSKIQRLIMTNLTTQNFLTNPMTEIHEIVDR